MCVQAGVCVCPLWKFSNRFVSLSCALMGFAYRSWTRWLLSLQIGNARCCQCSFRIRATELHHRLGVEHVCVLWWVFVALQNSLDPFRVWHFYGTELFEESLKRDIGKRVGKRRLIIHSYNAWNSCWIEMLQICAGDWYKRPWKLGNVWTQRCMLLMKSK
jgi:hypothetical protein